MPKTKTKKSAAKRFKITANGKITFARAGSGHLLGSKTRKRKRSLRHKGVLSTAETSRVMRMLSS